MQPEHEADDLQALLREEYAAPLLDKQFSADLIARLQAEATSLPSPASTPALTPATSRKSLLATCLSFAAIAASIIAVLWILNHKAPETIREVARRVKTDYNRAAHQNLDTYALESELARENERLDPLSDRPRSMSLSESLSENLSKSPASESKPSSKSLAARVDNLATEARAPVALSQPLHFSVLSTVAKEWPNVSAAAALADMLYVVDSGHLYEVNAAHGSRRSVGNDNWQNTAAMAATGKCLYLVSDNQLYEVDPKTGVRRSVGKPDWVSTKSIVAAGDKLYIADSGWLHRVSPSDGSHEVLHRKTESLHQTPEPKP